jgi:hypothetical protein
MNPAARPPRWAEGLLRLVLKPSDVASVSGDLLEAYRMRIGSADGPRRAGVWYVRQVLGFVTRSARWWGLVFGGVWAARHALDWFAPPVDFHPRANVSTYLAISLLLATGFWAARRSGSFFAGTLAGAVTAATGAVVSSVGAVALLAIWHSPETMAAIRGSGGLDEVFTLAPFMVLPGVLLGSIGGLVGAAGRRLRSE